MSVLRRAWPLAGALFVTLASADIASAGPVGAVPTPERTAAGQTDLSTFHLFGKTWCFGHAPQAVPCDHTVPASTSEPTTVQQNAADRPLEKVMTAVRRLFTGSPSPPSTADDGQKRG